MHHAFPNAVGTLSQRGRFHGWEKVHDAAAEVLHRGLWKPNGDEERASGSQSKRANMRGDFSRMLSYCMFSFFLTADVGNPDAEDPAQTFLDDEAGQVSRRTGSHVSV